MGVRDREFAQFVDANTTRLRRTAYLLCGDWHRAEDLVQVAFLKVYKSWPKVASSPLGYARQTLTNTVIDESRRFWRREQPTYPLPDTAGTNADQDIALDLRRAMAALPPRQRAAVVLRYWDDLPIAAVADLLGCSEGTVKSQCAKGLAALREMVTDRLEGHR
ncbi:SigE family RNA polymerase sigma factor [Kibdelosporangium persicum]|uniref:RNA polymerase sigma factor sigM n=1 Tax=Kibdelosporangium persicum TaxID=2698649 RepID=A0ABX2FAM8_9PSEU|nr:SigE family RNA polymerase sigma factor [Kibdelosporangium persicum]NRN67828.1 RNA polymerase sigma factor sigM [Kibdelosporangium persicum]